MRANSTLIITVVAVLLTGCSPSQNGIGRHFTESGVEGTFILKDYQTGKTIVHNPQRAQKGFLPASTYKIPNTLIALETGVAGGLDFRLSWDSTAVDVQAWWPEVWKQDHTLRTALPNSVVWFYQEMSRRVGPEQMQDYINRFDYGNKDISGGIDQFWLSGGTRISAEEQIDFLERFYFGDLDASSKHISQVKELLVLEETDIWRLNGKTGWAAPGENKPQVGWLIGYLEREGKIWFFALNIDIEENEDVAKRLPITKDILRSLDLIENEKTAYSD